MANVNSFQPDYPAPSLLAVTNCFIPARSMLPLSSIVDNDGSLRLLNKKTMAYFDYTARVERDRRDT
jgi:hypothetical protein